MSKEFPSAIPTTHFKHSHKPKSCYNPLHPQTNVWCLKYPDPSDKDFPIDVQQGRIPKNMGIAKNKPMNLLRRVLTNDD